MNARIVTPTRTILEAPKNEALHDESRMTMPTHSTHPDILPCSSFEAMRSIDFYVLALGADVLERYQHGAEQHVSDTDLGAGERGSRSRSKRERGTVTRRRRSTGRPSCCSSWWATPNRCFRLGRN
jgi:hypothetical protein